MRKLLYKVKQLAEGVVLNLHGNMLRVEHDTMLIIIYIRRILKSPLAAVYGHGNDPVVLSRRMIYPSRITFILPTKQTFRITALLCILCRRNRFRIFFRFGEVDGDIQIAVLCRGHPLLILLNAVAPDIIRILTQLIKIIRGFFGISPIFFPECPDDLARSRRKQSHDLCIKEIAVHHTVFRHQAFFIGVIHHLSKNCFQFSAFHCDICVIFFQIIQTEKLQQAVGCINFVFLFNQAREQAVLYHFFDILLNHFDNLLNLLLRKSPAVWDFFLHCYSLHGPSPISTT